MKRSRLRCYVFISVLVHILLLWLLRFLPPYKPLPPVPVAIRLLDTPTRLRTVSAPAPKKARKTPEALRRTPQKRVVPRPKKGGVLAELPRPVRIERPDEAQIVSRFDSKAQDIGLGVSAARKASGHKPPKLPPELALPQRYSTPRPTAPQVAVSRPTSRVSPPLPPVLPPRASRPPAAPPRASPQKQPRLQAPGGTLPAREQPSQQTVPGPLKRHFRITAEQEVAMLQRRRAPAEQASKEASKELLARFEQSLPMPSFDAPGIYEQGPEQPGEGRETTGGGKYRSIDAFGLKHFSYLVGVKRKIELVFSVPFFRSYQGTVGVPIVGFTIRRNGELAEAVLLRSSGYSEVDRALLGAVKRAAPYGPFPEHLPDKNISIRVYATLS